MRFDQNKEGGIYPCTNPETYTLDQWRVGGAGATGAFTTQRVAATCPGFSHSLNCTVTTSQATLAATDNFHIEYPIEGNYIADWCWGTANAQTITVSFWVIATVAGDKSFSIMNGINTRCYVSSFTVTTANTWQRVSVTIPGDTGTTWPSTAGTFGAKLLWSLGVGSTYSTSTTETWQAAAFWNKTGTDQLIQQTAGNVMFITGVQCELGSTMTDFEHRSYTEELLDLQRYYYKTFPAGTAVGSNQGIGGSLAYITQSAGVNGNGLQLRYPTTMSVSPTITAYCPSASGGNWYNASQTTQSSAMALFWNSPEGSFLYNLQVGGDNKGAIISVHMTANARLGGS